MNRLLCLCLVSVLGACNNPGSSKKSFVDVKGIDPSVKPGDNFSVMSMAVGTIQRKLQLINQE